MTEAYLLEKKQHTVCPAHFETRTKLRSCEAIETLNVEIYWDLRCGWKWDEMLMLGGLWFVWEKLSELVPYVGCHATSFLTIVAKRWRWLWQVFQM